MKKKNLEFFTYQDVFKNLIFFVGLLNSLLTVHKKCKKKVFFSLSRPSFVLTCMLIVSY